MLVLSLFPTPTHVLSFLSSSPLLQCFQHAFLFPFLPGPAEALKTLKGGWQSCRPKRDQRVAEGRGGLPAHGGRIRMEVARACSRFLPGKNLLKARAYWKKNKNKAFCLYCIHPSKKNARVLEELITIMPDNQSRERTGKSYPANTGYFPKRAGKHNYHSPLTRRLSPFFTTVGHCDPYFVPLGVDYQLTISNPFCFSFLPLVLRNENQGSQPRCVTSTYS